MMNEGNSKAYVDIRTRYGTVIQAQLAETPAEVLLHTPQVLCQVVVGRTQPKTQKELIGRRDA